MIRISRSVVPNFFTVGNMFAGYMSILFAVYQQNTVLAAWMIVLAAFLDAIDGKIARITNSSSKFGVEYDSLADVVSFGAAPSVLIYEFYFQSMDLEMVAMLLSFFPLLFGSIRLARFNVELTGFTKTHFNGLPSPMSAISLASFVLFINHFFEGYVQPRIIIFLTLLVSLLMVSNVRYSVFPQLSFRGDLKQKIIFAGLIVTGILIFFFPYMLLFPMMMIYVMGGLVYSLFKRAQASARYQRIIEKRKKQ